MALNYITVDENDFSLGIDARSSENQIRPGFVRDLLNADIVERRVVQRTGYQGFGGNLPVRVNSFEYIDSTNKICFNLDSSVDLGSSSSSPIVVYGRSSSIAAGGPFTTGPDVGKYYPAFSIPLRKPMIATSGAPPFETILITQDEHGLPTSDMFVGVAEATSSINRSYQTALPHDRVIDVSSADISVEYQNSTGIDKDVFVYYSDKQAVTGTTYIATLNHTGSGSEVFTIPSGTHGLANFNIVAQIQEDRTTEVAVIKPDSFIIESDGDVVITINNPTSNTYYAILTTAVISDQETGNVPGNSTGTITLNNLTSPWVFYSIYLEEIAGGDRDLVYADTIDYDDATGTATLSFTNGTVTPKNFVCFYTYGITRSNQLCVTDVDVTVSSVDTSPQLTIWGLDHQEIYNESAENRAGWVNHIDSYRSAGEQRMISGLGGNLFDARTYAESGGSYQYAKLYPNLRARTDISKILGPLFWDTGDTPARTRGYITGDNSGTNWATITSVEYDTGNDWTKYTISLPNKAILDSSGTPTTLASVISVTTDLEDWLSVQDMSYARHNGTFRIRQVGDGTDEIFIWVENSSNSVDYDDLNTGGEAAVFTDQFTWLTSPSFLPGDILNNAAIGDLFVCNVLSSSGTTTVSDGLIARLEVAAGITTIAARTSNVISTRTAQPGAVADVTNLVRGDMISYSGIERLLRVNSINADVNRSVDIVWNSVDLITEVTLLSGDTSFLAVGNSVIFTQAGVYSGVQVVTDITSPTEFTIDSSLAVNTSSATLLGNTVEVDEQLGWGDSIDDSQLFRTETRWIPIEAPDDLYDLTPSTYVEHFRSGDYDNQNFLRSTMVQNNMYLTNGVDPVMKYDGVNVYRAGLFPWQPGLFITQDTAATAKIVADNPKSIPTGIDENVFEVPLGDEQKFLVGNRLRHSFSGGFNDYTILNTYNDNTSGFVKVQRVIATPIALGTSPVLTLLSIRRYYFRLNAVDANNNIIASAVTGFQDHVVELAEDAAVNIKLVGLPSWDIYDYDRLEVEIYGTKLNTPAPFYKITTLQMDFDNTEGYINYSDSFVDTDLIDLDVVSSALLGLELGVAWQQPLAARYITSLGNSLVLGNVEDYPQIDLQIVASGAVTNTTYAGKIFTLRRSNFDTNSDTLMPSRARYELKQASTAVTVTSATGTLNTSFTATVNNTAVAGDWVYLFWNTVATSGRPLTYSGWWQIASATGTTLTINYTQSEAGVVANFPDRALFATDPTDIPVPLGVDGNMGMVNGDSFDLFDLGRRLSMAINASQRMVDVTISGMEDYTPWVTARGGNDVGKAGRIIIRQPKIETNTLELELPSSFTDGTLSFQVFVNEVRRSVSTQISATTRRYPSRILVSYENYPELFDSPTSVLDTESDSAIDVNSADGQEVTGILPFFGEAAFGAAQQSAVLVVFKTNSIYLVDINEKRAGRNPVQRIETEGLGCTAPYSIAVTKNGITFANESGIYCLRRNQAIEYIGKYMERNWTERANLDQLSLAQGHHYGIGRAYKLSIPVDTDTSNSQVYVYNHTGEQEGGAGSWSRYTNHPATGWANLGSDAFFGSSKGRVFSLRNTGTSSDFRDDSSSIQFRLDTRPMDFGNPNIRKVLDKTMINYRTLSRNTGTTVSFSVDLSDNFDVTTSPIIPKPTATDGLDSPAAQAVVQISHSTSRRRGTYFQVRIENSSIDQNIEIAGIGCSIGGLTSDGILEAEASRKK